jgi:hypothetical protein
MGGPWVEGSYYRVNTVILNIQRVIFKVFQEKLSVMLAN